MIHGKLVEPFPLREKETFDLSADLPFTLLIPKGNVSTCVIIPKSIEDCKTKKPTAPGVLRRSLIQVLTRPNVA